MMALSAQLLEQLLYEEESPTLDFKRDQYPFEGATDEAKSELLKDILAFTNAWRRSDAYILIGIDEVKGGRSAVVGVTKHLDDAKLQQFVNSKTQRPVHFSYQQARLDNLDIGVLYIPPQERPVYLVKAFGKLKKQTVYVRRSSSTDIASPDEIARMGQAITAHSGSLPLLELQFFDPNKVAPLGESIEVETVNLDIPEDNKIPDYGVMRFHMGLGKYHTMPSFDKNRNYYRDFAIYLKKTRETSRVEFYVYNAGNVLAQDVRVELVIHDPESSLIFLDSSDMPDEPSPSSLMARVPHPVINQDVNVQHSSDNYVITANLGKVQPKASAHTTCGLFVGSRQPAKIDIAARLFADNLPAPRECILKLILKPRSESLSVEKLLDMIDRKTPNNSIDSDKE